ncbi:MAG: AIR carboxylase family protein, partial [Chloroflexi bacterium]|nr:AIR carboxylase family protein [Chloroflexota bacterium]
MQKTLDVLGEMGVDYEVTVMSAHRAPAKVH